MYSKKVIIINSIKYIALKEDEGHDIQWLMVNRLNLSRNFIRKSKVNNLMLNGKRTFTNQRVVVGDVLQIVMEDEDISISPEDIELDILYEDDDVLAVNKPGNMLVHPTCLQDKNTLANGVIHHFQKQSNYKLTFRPVNRLDRETSGIVLIAKGQFVHGFLARHTEGFKKIYTSLVEGVIKEEQGTIELPIGRSPGSIVERRIDPIGQHALTHYVVEKRFKDASLIEVELITGRTHQIRVHMRAIGHPIVGDTLYGKADQYINRQALHCKSLSFNHPNKGTIIIEAPLPQDMKNAIDSYNNKV